LKIGSLAYFPSTFGGYFQNNNNPPPPQYTTRGSDFIRWYLPKTLTTFVVQSKQNRSDKNILRAVVSKNIKIFRYVHIEHSSFFTVWNPLQLDNYRLTRSRTLNKCEVAYLDDSTVIEMFRKFKNLNSFTMPITSSTLLQFFFEKKPKIEHLKIIGIIKFMEAMKKISMWSPEQVSKKVLRECTEHKISYNSF